MRRAVKELIIGRVRATFSDGGGDEQPVQRHPDGLFGPGSVAWRVHGDVATMMVGGVAALLMQMLHPAVLAGVWDHSSFRKDMHGRLRRTARFIALTTYGSRADADAALARVREIHRRIRGHLPDGTAYSAEQPELLAWVHATETVCFLDAWRRYAQPMMRSADQDRYFAEMATIGAALGAAPVPANRSAMLALIETMRPQLRSDERTREVANFLLQQRSGPPVTWPVQQLTFQAAIELLPEWARRMHGLNSATLARPLIHVGTAGLAEAIRWAFRPG